MWAGAEFVSLQEKSPAQVAPNSTGTSIFARYYSPEAFVDRFAARPDGAIDVIIPVLNTNELWEKNLISIYREIPVNRLLLGNAGCTDDTIAIARKFPRVEVHDHSSFKTLGYSIKELIKTVETDWFAYLHADVYLPDGWFNTMRSHQAEFDWFGCPMQVTVLGEYRHIDPDRPYAGSQMGRKAAFLRGIDKIDDDYVYRQEDFVFASIVEHGLFRHGRVQDTFHYHQVMPRAYGDAARARSLKAISIEMEMTEAEELHTAETQLRGTIKYLKPDKYQIRSVEANVLQLKQLNRFDFDEFIRWVAQTDPEWVPHIPRPMRRLQRYQALVRSGFKAVVRHVLEYLLYKVG
jgi:hypothetical protein